MLANIGVLEEIYALSRTFFFLVGAIYVSYYTFPVHDSEPLPLLGQIGLFKVLGILIAQLEVDVLHRFFNPLLATDTNDGAYTLLDSPAGRNARHADIVLLGHLFDSLDDLLVGCGLALVDECAERLVRFCALRGAVTPGTREGTASDGRPWDQTNARVLTVWNLSEDVSAARWHMQNLGGACLPSRALPRGREGYNNSASR